MDNQQDFETQEQQIKELKRRLLKAENDIERFSLIFFNHTHSKESGEAVRNRAREDQMRALFRP